MTIAQQDELLRLRRQLRLVVWVWLMTVFLFGAAAIALDALINPSG